MGAFACGVQCHGRSLSRHRGYRRKCFGRYLVSHRTYVRKELKVAGKSYFKRQATTLIKFAQSTSDPKLVAALVDKAIDLRSNVDEVEPPPSDLSPRAPDVEGPP
jgi:hypothetical protein